MAVTYHKWKYTPTKPVNCAVCGGEYRKESRGQKHCINCRLELEGKNSDVRKLIIERIQAASKHLDKRPPEKPRKHNLTVALQPNELAARRQKLGISQAELALESDVSLRSIQAAEQGWRRPNKRVVATLEQLENAPRTSTK